MMGCILGDRVTTRFLPAAYEIFPVGGVLEHGKTVIFNKIQSCNRWLTSFYAVMVVMQPMCLVEYLYKIQKECVIMNMADRIQTLRKQKGVSQEELADQIGVSRQAVSKWESEQSFPEIEKIILLSDYFNVSTDYLLKGIEPIVGVSKRKADARIFSVTGTAFNFIGIVVSIMIWTEEQTSISVAVGFIIMAIGCMIFAVGQFIGENKRKAAIYFGLISIWFLSLIPISCIFNAAQGVIGGYSWTFSPMPYLGNSIAAYMICWISYFAICAAFDVVMLKLMKR